MARNFLFVCDSGSEIGGGHVMRCLTLARALEGQGAECAFLGGGNVGSILQAFGAPNGGAVGSAEPGAPGFIEAAVSAADGFGAEIVVADHYRLSDADEARLRQGRKLAVIDDLAERPHLCGILIDPGFVRLPLEVRPEARSGSGWGDVDDRRDASGIPPPAPLRSATSPRGGGQELLGPTYALVRPEFAARREASLLRRGAEVRRALIAPGLTDFGGVTAKILGAIAPHRGDMAIDVAVGGQAPSLRSLIDLAWSDARLTLHVDAPDMAKLMTDADLCIGAGGSSTWERATLGLPAITLILADNQAPGAERLAEVGATVAVDARRAGWEAGLAEAWSELIADAERRAALSKASAALCDGLGAGRVAEALLAL